MGDSSCVAGRRLIPCISTCWTRPPPRHAERAVEIAGQKLGDIRTARPAVSTDIIEVILRLDSQGETGCECGAWTLLTGSPSQAPTLLPRVSPENAETHSGAISAVINFTWLPHSPFWAMLLIAIDLLVIWALASARGQSNAIQTDSAASSSTVG